MYPILKIFVICIIERKIKNISSSTTNLDSTIFQILKFFTEKQQLLFCVAPIQACNTSHHITEVVMSLNNILIYFEIILTWLFKLKNILQNKIKVA